MAKVGAFAKSNLAAERTEAETEKLTNGNSRSPKMWIVYQQIFPHIVVATAYCGLAPGCHMI
jgi:hypothetical protein